MRKLGHPLPGAYDIVKIAAAVTVACALPYTTAVKRHVAVEFFYHRLGRRGRTVADTLIRLVVTAMFSLFTWQFIAYGARLRSSGEISELMQKRQHRNHRDLRTHSKIAKPMTSKPLN